MSKFSTKLSHDGEKCASKNSNITTGSDLRTPT